MLGWHISVYRQPDGGASPATAESPEGVRLAVWQTGHDGLNWLDDLVKDGKADALGGNGYPLRYTAVAEHLLPRLIGGPPGANETWVSAPTDIITDKWEGRTVIDRNAAEDCRPDEWLVVEAWDES